MTFVWMGIVFLVMCFMLMIATSPQHLTEFVKDPINVLMMFAGALFVICVANR